MESEQVHAQRNSNATALLLAQPWPVQVERRAGGVTVVLLRVSQAVAGR